MIIQAIVKRTKQVVFLRKPYEGEYISSMYEPDYIQIDNNYNTIQDSNGNYVEFDVEELEDIQYI